MGKHPIRCGFMCALQIALTLGQVAHATLSRTLRGRRGLWPFWAKRPKFTQTWSLEKLYLRIMETFSTPQSLKHTIYGKKCIYRRYWYVHIFGSLRNKKMSKHFWGRPIVAAFKYAHYG